MNIGIIGCSGDVGRGIAKYLSEKKYTVYGVQRHIPNEFSECYNPSCSALDINDEENLKAFVEKCDMIVNCIAPAYIYSHSIARIAGEAGCIYLDLTDCIVSGELPGCGTYITSCGYIPGISAILPKIVIDEYFDEVYSAILVQGGSELCSNGALKDIILSSEKSGYIDSFYRDGEIVRLAVDARKKFTLPFMGDEVILKPFLSHEMIDFAKLNNIRRLKWFNAYENISQFTFFLRLIGAVPSGNPEKIDSLIASERKKRSDSGKILYSAMIGDVCGSKNGMKKCVRFTLLFSGMNKLCSVSAGSIADKVLRSAITPGIYFGYQFSTYETISEIREYLRENGSLDISEIPVESSFEYLLSEDCGANLYK